MAFVNRRVSATVSLSAATCYRELTGRCSLDVIAAFSVSPNSVLAENDILFCPRLLKQWDADATPLTVTPCDCGDVQVVSGLQRACIAAKKQLPLPLLAVGQQPLPLCDACAEHGDHAQRFDLPARIPKEG